MHTAAQEAGVESAYREHILGGHSNFGDHWDEMLAYFDGKPMSAPDQPPRGFP